MQRIATAYRSPLVFGCAVSPTPIHVPPFQLFLPPHLSRACLVAAAAPIPAPRASGPAFLQMMMQNRQQPLTINPRSGAMAANATILGQVMRIGEYITLRRSVGFGAQERKYQLAEA